MEDFYGWERSGFRELEKQGIKLRTVSRSGQDLGLM